MRDAQELWSAVGYAVLFVVLYALSAHDRMMDGHVIRFAASIGLTFFVALFPLSCVAWLLDDVDAHP